MSVTVTVAMAMTVPLAMTVGVSMRMRVGVARNRPNSSILLQLLDSPGMDRSRIGASGLDTGMRQ